MAKSLTPPIFCDEAQRLVALDEYQVLQPTPEAGLDTIVRHAQRIFDVPIALVCFVTKDQLYLKARLGMEACAVAREDSFCTHTIMGRDVMVVPDATLDARFRQSKLVTRAPGIRFYAGAPLVAPGGFALGAVCITDVKPRPQGLSPSERESLADLAELVMVQLEAGRLSTAEADGRRRFNAVAGSSADAIICADKDGRILSWNGAAETMFGYAADEVIGDRLSFIIPDRFRPMHEAGLQRVAAGLPTKLVGSLVTVPALRRDGTEFPIELSLSHWTEGGEHRFGAITRDITERVAAEAFLKHAAEYDHLTDLANRAALTNRLETVAAGGSPASLILLDLDGFKDVNDNLGHAAGDVVLKAVADRLRHIVGESGLPCRLGGDEFVVVLEGSADPLSTVDLADQLIKAIECPVEIGERAVYVGASAGVSFFCGESWSSELLLEQADLALYKAKADGKGRVRLFTQDLWPIARSRVSVSSGIRQAWEQNEFELYYQPQIRLADGALVGAEALLRWNHRERGVLAPAAFLSTLESSLLAIPVSEWILCTACRQAAAWRAAGFPEFRIGVNLFAAQFKSRDLPGLVEKVLREAGLPAGGLELEITENTILRNDSRIHASLVELRKMGVGIAFDDYGTGFASLTMLKDFPVTRLKIDRCFVSGPDDDDRNPLIVEAIARLAHGFDLKLIAEGIETREQADLMRSHCEEGQGYFFCKPVTASAFAARFSASDRRNLRSPDGARG